MKPLKTHESDGPDTGDERVDATLYDRYGSAVFAYLRLHRASWEDAEDLTLEIFTAALERDNLRGLNEQKQLAWLLRVAHNKLVDGYRRSTHHPLVSLHSIEEPLEQTQAGDPEYSALRHEESARLREAMGGLSSLQRQVVQLRYGADLSFSEIGLLLKKNEGAVRKLLSRALASLRSTYRDQQF
ncbi:MAG: sigma-70 family RNA polymerase sigma factor [Ktedonobacteraceae bacterium]|nr:sigma-70 family RNA polymerase sigma factor [Ktedonobacteraceae bacterium]